VGVMSWSDYRSEGSRVERVTRVNKMRNLPMVSNETISLRIAQERILKYHTKHSMSWVSDHRVEGFSTAAKRVRPTELRGGVRHAAGPRGREKERGIQSWIPRFQASS
jgi:hypothetical protein